MMSCILKDRFNDDILRVLYAYTRPKNDKDYTYTVSLPRSTRLLYTLDFQDTLLDATIYSFLQLDNDRGTCVCKNTYIEGYSMLIGMETNMYGPFSTHGLLGIWQASPSRPHTFALTDIILAQHMAEDSRVWRICRLYCAKDYALVCPSLHPFASSNYDASQWCVSILPHTKMNPTEYNNWKHLQNTLTVNLNRLVHMHQKNTVGLPLRHFV